MSLAQRRILLGVSGGIAAYKSCELVRRLREQGAEVRVVTTAGAEHFVGAATFQALSGQPVRTSLWDASAEPAMNQQMWAHPAVQANLAQLRQRGVQVLGPAAGEQACGDVGSGRMLEPHELRDALAASFGGGALAGLQVVVSAGPTFEDIDPVRFIGNRSSGKMGFAVAQAAAEAGANVTLVAGPVSLATPPGVARR